VCVLVAVRDGSAKRERDDVGDGDAVPEPVDDVVNAAVRVDDCVEVAERVAVFDDVDEAVRVDDAVRV